MKKRVFLTGASGYLGTVLLDHLLRDPDIDSITGIGLRPPPGLASSRFNFVPLDIRSAGVADAMSGHHVVIHGAYHRGQIAKLIGRAGGKSLDTDFILFARDIEPGSSARRLN